MVRPAFPIRLVALDIDGTLIGDDLVVGRRTRVAVRAAMDNAVGAPRLSPPAA